MLEAAGAAKVPLDITAQPGLWGGRLRAGDAFFTYVGNGDFATAPTRTEAANCLQADVIQVLSAIGREMLDVYFLRARGPVQEQRLDGALEALESARQQGHVRFVGLCCDCDPSAAPKLWEFHDAFELLLAPCSLTDHRAFDTLAAHARRQRAGMITARNLQGLGDGPLRESALHPLRKVDAEHPALIPVRSARDIEIALSLDSIKRQRPGEAGLA